MAVTGVAMGEPTAETVAVGRVGTLGQWKVGASSIYVKPLRAEIVLWTNAPGRKWESNQIVLPGQVVFATDTLYRVQMVAGATGGSVGFAPIAAPSTPDLPAGAVILAEGGKLRVDGPDIAAATDIRVLRWLPDEQHPQSAEVEFWPAKWGRSATKPEDFHRVDLASGGHAQFGQTGARVISLQGASADHPGWIVLRLSHPE